MSVDQECLESFLKTAQLLRVKGLTDDGNPNPSSSNSTGPNGGSGNNNNNFSAASLPSRNGNSRLSFNLRGFVDEGVDLPF